MEDLRVHLHAMWGSVAPSWREHADFIDERSRPLTEQMLALAAPQRGERVLELACGPATVALAAAPMVAPGGEVVASDVAEAMVAIAADRAAEHGLDNVRWRCLDMEEIDEPDGSFDVVFCRWGLMLVPDPARAAGEIRRVLRPGGRAAIVVWGPKERNPWLGVVFDAVSDELGAPVPPLGVPQPFSLQHAAAFDEALRAGGFADVALSDVDVPLHAPSFDDWWLRTVALAGPLAAVLAGLPPERAQSLRGRLQDAARPYANAEGLDFPGVALLAVARR